MGNYLLFRLLFLLQTLLTVVFGTIITQIEFYLSKNDNSISSLISSESAANVAPEKEPDNTQAKENVEQYIEPEITQPIQPQVEYSIPAGFFASFGEAEAYGYAQLNGKDKASCQVYLAGYLPNGTPYYGVDFWGAN